MASTPALMATPLRDHRVSPTNNYLKRSWVQMSNKVNIYKSNLPNQNPLESSRLCMNVNGLEKLNHSLCLSLTPSVSLSLSHLSVCLSVWCVCDVCCGMYVEGQKITCRDRFFLPSCGSGHGTEVAQLGCKYLVLTKPCHQPWIWRTETESSWALSRSPSQKAQ